MQKKPLIGLTTRGLNNENKECLAIEYIQCVRSAGGIPVLLPAGEKNVDSILEHLDGVILTGGTDVHPDRYRGSIHPQLSEINPGRDESDFRIAETVLKQDIPVLGICRGMQVLNVCLGGTLYQHLPESFGQTVAHQISTQKATGHSVKIIKGSRLHNIVSNRDMEIVSWHHQAVDEIPQEFTITAWAADGVVEAVEMKSHRWLVAVQWHPELSAGRDIRQQKLFDELIKACRQPG